MMMMTTMMMNKEPQSIALNEPGADSVLGPKIFPPGAPDDSHNVQRVPGRLVIAGTGITAIAHMTSETIGHIRNADVIFYHVTSGVVATQIREINPNAVDLYAYYGEGKTRTVTYIQMAELMLREVRRGRYVLGLFHGHPGFFVKAGRRALAIARIEGHVSELLPGISTPDCLFADLRIDPGVIGVQIMKASHIIRTNVQVATNNHLVLLQVSSVGDNTFSYKGYNKARLDEFFSKLISLYGDRHESVYYVAAIFPGFAPVVKIRELKEYRQHEIRETVSASTLYLPPKGVPLHSLTALQAFDDREPYDPEEMKIIAELDGYVPPSAYKRRGASIPMMRVMDDLANLPEMRSRFHNSPEEFLAACGGLDLEERQALMRRSPADMRSVMDDHYTRDLQTVRPSQSLAWQSATTARGRISGSLTATPDFRLGMEWTPAKQVLRFGENKFVHHGPTETHPSHDLAHLLIAANGNLLWVPEGPTALIKLAEYNAIFLEHLLNNIYTNVSLRRCTDDEIFARTLSHARWFVENHFAPFPVSAEEAYSQFCRNIQADIVADLCPHFFTQKRAEQADANFILKSWTIQIKGDEPPTPIEKDCAEFKLGVKRQLTRLCR
jgi:Tetrapyrrole (Corrin/Porphyrin) Methylases